MSTTPQTPDSTDGMDAIRSDVDDARSELEATLTEIEARLNPQRVIVPVKAAAAKATKVYTDHRGTVLAAASSAAVAVGGIIVAVARSRRK
jgi:hypothetical protein